MSEKLTTFQIKKIFTDVVNGYTAVVEPNTKGKAYVKHLTPFDSVDVDKVREDSFNRAKDMGLPTEEDQEKQMYSDDLWSKEKDEEVAQLERLVDGLKNTHRKLFLKSQKDQIKKQLSKQEKKLDDMKMEKMSLFSNTAEDFSRKKVNEYYMYMSLRKDVYLEEKFFDAEEYDDLPHEGLANIIVTYNQETYQFISHNFKLVALSPVFLNYFYLCEDNAVNFYGKPIVELSFYQTELFGYGLRFKNILSDSKNPPPDDIANDPERLLEWSETNKNATEQIDKINAGEGEGQASSLVGATAEDLEYLGIDPKAEGISLEKAAAEKGGSLNMQDLMKLHGV